MSTLNLNTLKEGDHVAVACHGNWNISSQGFYIVKKANKVRIIVARERDGYEREFSTRTGVEKGSERYRSAFIETVADQQSRTEANKYTQSVLAAWSLVEEAGKRKNFAALIATTNALKLLLDPKSVDI